MSKKLNIVYDVSVFASGNKKNANRSGIFFCAYNIFLNFLKADGVQIYLYADNEHILDADSFLQTMLASVKCQWKELKSYSVYKKKAQASANISKWTELVNSAGNPVTKICYRLCRKFNYLRIQSLLTCDSSDLDGIDCYFSPVFAVPEKFSSNNQLKKFTILHDTIPLEFPFHFPVLNYEFWYKKLIKQINCNDYYFTNSISTKTDFMKYFTIDPEKIYAIYHASSDRFSSYKDHSEIGHIKKKYNIPEDVHYIFSLCSVEPRKNLIFAVNGFIEFLAQNKTKNMIFVIGGASWPQFIDLFERSIGKFENYSESILRIGYVDDNDLPALYSGAMMFLYPSIYEGFGVPVLEAMQCGVPVITSNVSSIPEVAGDACIMINPNDLEALVRSIELLYNDPAKRKELSEKGLKQASKFTWAKSSDLMIEIMKRECI